MRARNAAVLGIVALGLGCSRDAWQRAPGPDDAVALVPWFATMKTDIAIRPYKMPLQPVEGTVPVGGGERSYPDAVPARDAEFGRMLPNPVERTAASLDRGRDRYEIYCEVCHGAVGDGQGPVAPALFGLVPSIITEQATNYTDGYLYVLVKDGRGAMPQYGDKVRGDDRWHIVNYLRLLQGTN